MEAIYWGQSSTDQNKFDNVRVILIKRIGKMLRFVGCVMAVITDTYVPAVVAILTLHIFSIYESGPCSYSPDISAGRSINSLYRGNTIFASQVLIQINTENNFIFWKKPQNTGLNIH